MAFKTQQSAARSSTAGSRNYNRAPSERAQETKITELDYRYPKDSPQHRELQFRMWKQELDRLEAELERSHADNDCEKLEQRILMLHTLLLNY
jgi:hypothetical protein